MRSYAAGALAFTLCMAFALCMGVPAYSQDIVCQNATIGFAPDGSLQDLFVDQTRIIKHAGYLLCEPVAADGSPVRIFSHLGGRNTGLGTIVAERQVVDGQHEFVSRGMVSGKVLDEGGGAFTFLNKTTVTPDGTINVSYEFEVTQTLKYNKFFVAVTLDAVLSDSPYAGLMDTGATFTNLFPKGFIKGSLKELRIGLPQGQLRFSASPESYWQIEDARTYGGDYVALYIVPSWFKKGMTLEKGRKESFAFTIQLPVANRPKAPDLVATTESSSESGPGLLVPTMDPYSGTRRAPNPLFLKNMPRRGWWHSDWQHRVPIVISEPIGKKRISCPIVFPYSLPEQVSVASVRVVTAGQKELPCQVSTLGGAENSVEIAFQVSLAPHEILPLFIYYGNAAAPASSFDTVLTTTDRETSVTVHNKRMLVEFFKTPPIREFLIRTIELFGSDGRNRIKNFMDSEGSFGVTDNKLRLDSVGGGAVFKEIVYASDDLSVTFRMFGDSNLLYYHIKGTRNTVRLTNNGLPYGDVLNDAAQYESRDGVRTFALNGLGYNRRAYSLTDHLKEGWVCLSDNRGEAYGQLFDRQETSVQVLQSEARHGVRLNMSPGPEGARGALVFTHGDHATVRDCYIDWTHPPTVLTGKPQVRPTHAPRPPDCNKTFSNVIFPLTLGNYPLNSTNIDDVCEGIVTAAIHKEANMLRVWMRLPGVYWPSTLFHHKSPEDRFLPRLVEVAHARGVGVAAITGVSQFDERFVKLRKHIPEGVVWGCAVGDTQFYADFAGEVAATGVDVIDIFDEFKCNTETKLYRDGFAKRYGMPFPGSFSYPDLHKAEQHNQVFYNFDVINALVEAAAVGAKAVNPNVLFSTAVSPANNLRSLDNGYHDLEAQSDVLDFASTDPYTTDVGSLKYTIKLCRGALGNGKPVHTYVGWSHYLESASEPEYFRRQILLHILQGANRFTWCGAGMSDCELPEVASAMKRALRLLDYTGLGDLVARAHPLKYVGVLRDRNGFFDSIRKGECRARHSLTDYDTRVDKVIQLRNIPTDMIFAKYFTLEALKDYAVVVLPGQRTLSDAMARVAAEYAKQGGTLIVQGECVGNPILAAVCKVADTAVTAGMTSVKGIGGAPNGQDLKVFDDMSVVRLSGATVLAEDAEGRPVVTQAQCGKGVVVYVASNNEYPFLKEIIEGLAGPLPLSIDSKVYSNVLQSDDTTILGVYNPNYKDRFTGAVRLNRSLAATRQVISVSDGKPIALRDGAFEVDVPTEDVRYYLLSSRRPIAIPTGAEIPLTGSMAYAPSTGMRFLHQAPIAKEESAAEEVKDDRLLDVAIFNGGDGKQVHGWSGIKDAFREGYVKYVRTTFISSLDEADLSAYDVVIIPTVNANSRPLSMHKGWQTHLRSYVENGGGVLLLHNSIGGRASIGEPVFPELGKARINMPIRQVKITENHPLIQGSALKARCGWDTMNPALDVIFRKAAQRVDDIVVCAYADHMAIEPGPAGSVIARSLKDGNQLFRAAVVVGEVGKGRAVLCGLPLGIRLKDGTEWDAEAWTPRDGELAILVNAVFWLAGTSRDGQDGPAR